MSPAAPRSHPAVPSRPGTFAPSPLPPRAPRRTVEVTQPGRGHDASAGAPPGEPHGERDRARRPAPIGRPRRRAAEEGTRPTLRVVERRSRASVVANRVVVAYWTVVLVGLLFCAVVMNASLAARQGRLDVVRNDVRSADLEYRRERAEVAELEAPERIAAAALRLGLERPTELRFLTPVASSSLASVDGDASWSEGSSDGGGDVR